jgi:hypothetical protein
MADSGDGAAVANRRMALLPHGGFFLRCDRY